MSDQAVWEHGVASARNNYCSLAPNAAKELEELIDDIKQLKQDLVELVISAGSLEICRTCGGECCRYGKYHVTALDIIVYLNSNTKLVVPDFNTHPHCPYSDNSGCTMSPCYRPMTCVVFNCQQIEDQLTSSQLKTFRVYEQKLRNSITQASCITGIRLERPLLLSCD